MEDILYTKKQVEYFIKGLTPLLPGWFRFHAKLISMSNRKTHEINCSINELAQKLDCNPYVVASDLSSLLELKFIRFSRPSNFDQMVTITILVYY